ncbi:MAG: glutaredoxin domain-containing protein, partial [Streptococcus orisratti]|nr:glutaredoxin domain-containing protein [Streptococcus orisratti]
MTYTFYEYPTCSTCKKAKAELETLGVPFESVNIKTNPPQVKLLRNLLENSG